MTDTLNKPEIITRVASATGDSKATVERVLTSLEEVVTDSLCEGRDVKISGFLALSTVTRPARTTKNPKTGEDVNVPARKALRIRPLSRLKRTIRAS